MSLQSTGTISFSNINVELGLSSTATITLNDAAVRTLAGTPSGAINLYSFYASFVQEKIVCPVLVFKILMITYLS